MTDKEHQLAEALKAKPEHTPSCNEAWRLGRRECGCEAEWRLEEERRAVLAEADNDD